MYPCGSSTLEKPGQIARWRPLRPRPCPPPVFSAMTTRTASPCASLMSLIFVRVPKITTCLIDRREGARTGEIRWQSGLAPRKSSSVLPRVTYSDFSSSFRYKIYGSKKILFEEEADNLGNLSIWGYHLAKGENVKTTYCEFRVTSYTICDTNVQWNLLGLSVLFSYEIGLQERYTAWNNWRIVFRSSGRSLFLYLLYF